MKGDLAEEIAKLKRDEGKYVAYGGASFAQSLIELDVVDDYRFLIQPVILGSGLSVFTKARELMELELVRNADSPRVRWRTFRTVSADGFTRLHDQR